MGGARGRSCSENKMQEERKFRRVRFAPPNALNRPAFAHACGVSYNTVRRWGLRGWLKPHWVFVMGQNPRPYYLPEQVAAFRDQKRWRSAAGMRLAKALFKRRGRDE